MARGFESSVVLVAGGGSGIGAAVAERFGGGGAQVVIGDIRGDRASETAARLRGSGLACDSFAVDVSQEREVERWLDEVVARHGGLDHLVDCAGISGRLTIPQMTVEQWRRVIDVNLTGAFVLLKLSQPHLAQRGGGSITVISSVAADHIAYLGGVHYAASKTALTGLVRHAAFEMGRQNIRVNAVGPGPMRNAMGGRERSLEDRQAAARNVPLQQVVEPQDIAEACAFLASPAARMVTGVYLPVDGGFLTGRGVNYRRYFELHGEAF